MQQHQDIKISEETYPVALTIAGSDSGGGAGIQADLRTFSSFGVYGTSVITAVTAQNPCQVLDIFPLQAEAVISQLEAVFSKFTIKSVKTGMLQDAAVIEAVAKVLQKKDIPIIVDPVMVSTSGSVLLKPEAIATLKEKILSISSWMTPNVAEAEQLLDTKITNQKEMQEAAQKCSEKWDTVCILKGGDFKALGKRATDIVASRGKLYSLSTKRVKTSLNFAAKISHGTGCTFSSAIAAALALDMPWKDTMIAAKAFVYGSLSETVMVGEDICAMYPPAGAYRDKVNFEKLTQ